MGLDNRMDDLDLARIQLKELVDRFDVIVITEKLFESLVLIAQRKKFKKSLIDYRDVGGRQSQRRLCHRHRFNHH